MYSSGEDGKHHFTAKGLVIVTCKACGEELSRTDITPDMVFAEKHVYRINDAGEGVCVCTKACPHDGEAVQGEPYAQDDRYEDNGDGTHTHAWDVYQQTRCSVCFQLLGTEKTGSDAAQEAHAYGEDGVCVCGAKQCAHEDRQTRFVYRNETAEDSGIPGLHWRVRDVYIHNICNSCGAEWTDEQPVQEEAAELVSCRYGEDGVCADCGAPKQTCAHERAYEDVSTQWLETLSSDGEQHTGRVSIYSQRYCPDCGEWLGEKTLLQEDLTVTQAHSFVSSAPGEVACAQCGAKKTCAHEQTVTAYENVFVSPDAELDDDGTVPADAEQVTRCALCGQEISREVVRGVRLDAQTAFGGGMLMMAATFDLSCTHTARRSSLVRKNGSAVSNKNKTHTITYSLYIHYSCPACGEEWDSESPLYTGLESVEPCRFEGGVCTVCGEKEKDVACKHPNLTRVREIDPASVKVVSSDRTKHVMLADIVSYAYCPDCLETSDFHILQKGALFNENHETYVVEDSKGKVCSRCGYRVADQSTCKHEKQGEWEIAYPGVPAASYTGITARTHTAVYASGEKVKGCLLCGKILDSQVKENVKVVQAHTYGKDNICTACGYLNTCTHKNAKTVKEYALIHDIRIDSRDKHSFSADQWEYWTCPDCGAASERRLIAENRRFTEGHAFDGSGICWFCGKQKPSPTPKKTSSATATPAPTPTPTPVPLKQDIVSAMLEAADGALLESKNADVAVIGAQEVMTAEEYAALRQLSLREQMLVTLRAIGLDDAVQMAALEMRVKLSDDAQKLMQTIAARMKAMTQEERDALAQTLETYFPVTETVTGGVTVRRFTIELQIVVDDFGRVERYQFYLDEDADWIFERVDLTDFGRVG